MKKTNQLLIACLLIATLSGCTLFKGDPNRPGYQEGRTAAFVYVATEPVQPAEINEAIKAGYGMLKVVFDAPGEDPVDAIIKTKIANAYPDATPEFHAFVFNFYSMARTRVMNEVDLHPDIPAPEVVENFLQGVKDSLNDWKPIMEVPSEETG